MIEFKPLMLHDHLSLLENEIRSLEALPENSPLSDKDIRRVDLAIKKILKAGQNYEFIFENEHALKAVSNLFTRIGERKYNSTSLQMSLSDFRSDLEIILRAASFAYIPPNRSRYFGQDKLFGDGVFKSFRSARDDIREAGNCFATGAYTASVFHLMRAVEISLRVLADDLEIQFPDGGPEYQEWSTIIENIKAKARERCDNIQGENKKSRRSEAREFYNGITGELLAFKDAWRNHVMHTRYSYDEPMTLSIMNHVREFMQRLSKRLKEGRRKQLPW